MQSSVSPRIARWETRSWPLFSPSVINPASWPGYGDWVSWTDSIDKSPDIVSPFTSHWSGLRLCIHWHIFPRRGQSDRESKGSIHGLCCRSNPLTCGEERDMNFINYLDCLCKYKTTRLRRPSVPQPSIYSTPSWSVRGQGPASGTDP